MCGIAAIWKHGGRVKTCGIERMIRVMDTLSGELWTRHMDKAKHVP